MSKDVSYDIRALREAADPLSVAEFIGIDIKNSDIANGKKNAAILCPAHDDRHYGSCHLTSKGFRCYSCGAKGDVIDMVCYHNGWDIHNKQHIKDAMGIVGDSCGGRELFQVAESTDETKARLRRTPVLSREQLELLGLYQGNDGFSLGVSIIVACRHTGDNESRPLERGEYIEWYPDEMDECEDGYELIKRCIDKNPLRTLAVDEPEAYMELIRNKCEESIAFYRELIGCITGRANSVYRDFCVQIAEAIRSKQLFIRLCENKIREVEDIFIEHGGAIKRPQNSKENLFGKIKLGNVL